MTLKIFNSLTQSLEEFKPLNVGKEVGLYTCGPTVYDYAHIGNFRAYIWEDILKRWLLYKGFKVKQVMNYTDVDDKTIRGATQNKIPLNEYTEKYKKAFMNDIKTMNILPADIYCAATEHIPEMVELIKKLLKKGIAYKGEDGSIYFSIKKFPKYGKLAHINVNELKAGARVSHDEYEKESLADFALWKAWDKEDGEVFWETELGKGRPGWHIECSAMSMKYLGESFDIHTGGVDNKFPHHENEIAQSEGATGKKFVKYWLHCEHLLVDGKKMSKSLGNYYTIKDLIGKGLNPKAIRYVIINSHYRQQLNFTIESVKDAEKTIEGIQNLVNRLLSINTEQNSESKINEIISKPLKGFEESMDSDLNVPLAMRFVFDFAKQSNKLIDKEKIGSKEAKQAIEFLKKIDSVIGVLEFETKKIDAPSDVKKMLEERNNARKTKDWKKADELREKINSKGFNIIDNKDGTTELKKI